MTRFFTEIAVEVEGPDGAPESIIMRNLGWDAAAQGYVSEFEVAGERHLSIFQAAEFRPDHCRAAQDRLAHDEGFLERCFGFVVIDYEMTANDPRNTNPCRSTN